MKNKSLTEIENELKKCLSQQYVWGRKQNDVFDKATNFIYDIFYFDELIKEIDKRFLEGEKYEDFKHYTLNRWYNFLSAKAVENIFKSHPKVTKPNSVKDKFVDFYIDNIPFDHKTTVFPKGFNKSLSESRNKPEMLMEWLYKNQSQQRRKHFHNRLFILLHSSDGEHWKLKAEISTLRSHILNYLDNFNPENLKLFNFQLKKKTYSDIIWIVK